MYLLCNICTSPIGIIFKEKVLFKYDINYFKCCECGFIQTEKPFWLKEAYETPINTSDIGLIQRNIHYSNIIPDILNICSAPNDTYLDYGGGYGIFVRIMRDKGYDFYLHDLYTENLFAKKFELKDYKNESKFKALTAFEVLEHFENPIEEIKTMFKFSDILIFSTELQPGYTLKKASDWWYISPETGQHISFYTLKALHALAEKLNVFVYSNGFNLHIFSKEVFKENPFDPKKTYSASFIKRLISKFFFKEKKNPIPQVRNSLLESDFELIKKQEMN